jgi:predicted RNA-binding protein (virulence factor B family)
MNKFCNFAVVKTSKNMIESGKYQTLRIERNSEFGLYLADEEGNEVLLPNRYVTSELQIGNTIEIFVYND